MSSNNNNNNHQYHQPAVCPFDEIFLEVPTFNRPQRLCWGVKGALYTTFIARPAVAPWHLIVRQEDHVPRYFPRLQEFRFLHKLVVVELLRQSMEFPHGKPEF